jgi:predicted nucleotide-binding protein
LLWRLDLQTAELWENLKQFKGLLEEHRRLWGKSLDSTLPDHPVRNHDELAAQQKRLSRLFYVLDPALTKYSRGRVMVYPATGAKWDIYRSAIGNDIAQVKGPSLENAILELEGIIALVEQEPAENHAGGAPSRGTRSMDIFISHGTPGEALQKLEKFIRALGLNPIIVKDEPSRGGAVDDVVSDYMGQCACVVVLATSDDKVSEGFQPRPNVLHEIGMAQEKLGDRIIYLKEEGCKFPSNVSPKIWENFSQANMEWALIKVAKELRAFGIVRTV